MVHDTSLGSIQNEQRTLNRIDEEAFLLLTLNFSTFGN
jgi:hypothetical protein